MLTAFVNRIASLSKIRTFELNGLTYSNANGLSRIKLPAQMSPKLREFETLSAIIEYIEEVPTEGLFLSVLSPVIIDLFGPMEPGNDNVQFHYARAGMGLSNFGFNHDHELEPFIIQLLAMFDESEDKDLIIGMLSHLANENVISNRDDGNSQSLQVKTSLTTKANETVKNPVMLKPFRTFREVAQPESGFILRYKNAGGRILASLTEADGGAWQLEAIKNIKEFLKSNTTNIKVIG